MAPEDLPIFTGTTGFFFTPMSLETTRERKEKGGERGEKKEGLLALIIFILPTLEIVSERHKRARDTPLGHLNRAVPFSKIRVDRYIYIYRQKPKRVGSEIKILFIC